jgi:hypothetical protein
MPNISYLRELSLIKSGYTPSEAKSIVDNENILKFQNQSEETKNAYRNYYAGLFTNSGSSVKGVSITPYSVKASSLGLSSRQPNAFIGGDITAPATVDDYISRGVGLRPLPAPVRQNTNFGTGLDITTNAPVQGFKPLPVPEIKRPQAPQAPQVSQPTQVAQDTVPQLQPLNITPPKNTPVEEIQAPVVAKPLKPISLSANFLLPTRKQAFRYTQLDFYTNISPKEKEAEIATINNLTGQAISPNLKDQPIKPIFNESLSGLLDPTKPINERVLDGQMAIKVLNEDQKPIFGKDQTKAIDYVKGIISRLQTDNAANQLYNMAGKIFEAEDVLKFNLKTIFETQDPKLMGPPSLKRDNSLLGPRIPKILGKSEYDIYMELAAPDIYSWDPDNPSKLKLNDNGIALQAILRSKSDREALDVLKPEQLKWATNYINGLQERLEEAVQTRPIKAQTELEKEYTREIPIPQRLSYLSSVAERNPDLLSLDEKKEHNFLVDQYNKQIEAQKEKIDFFQKEVYKKVSLFNELSKDLDLFSPYKEHWLAKLSQDALEANRAKQSLYEKGRDLQGMTFIGGNPSTYNISSGIGFENWWNRTILNPLASSRLSKPNLSDKEFQTALKEYIQTDDYPIIDRIASEQAGRIVSAGEFVYFKKEGKLLGFLPVPAIGVGTGFSYEGPGIVLDMIPSLFVTAGIGTIAGGSIKAYARYSKAQTFKKLAEVEKIADVGTRAKQVAELLTTNARTQRILKAAEVKNWQGAYRSFSQSAIAAQGTWAGRQAAKLLYNSTPTMIGVGATTYHKIYRQTLKQYYNEGVENAEEKAATTAKLLTAVEMITEGLNPDINYFFPKGTLDPESFFGKLANYFGGKKIQSVQDYRRIISMLDINPKSADVFARMLYWTKNGLDKGVTFTKVMAKTGMNFNEGLEEVLASLGGHAVELMQFPVTGIQPEELSAESLLNDFVGGMFLTGPMGVMQLENYFKEEKLQRAYRMAINPEVHKAKINNLVANGKISQEQAVKALLQIDNLSKVFEDSTFDNLVNEATFLDDKEAQYQYFKDKVNKDGLDKFMETTEFANLSEEEKEKVIKNAEEIGKNITTFKRRADAFSNLSEQEKQIRLKNIADRNLKIVSKGSLYEMQIALESQRREKAITRINSRPVFEKIKGPMEYMENELIRMIDERKAVIKNAKDNDELNPLFEDVYLPDESAPKAGISVESTSDVLTMLMQAAVNPDTKNILKDLRKNLVMLQVKEEALNKITQEYLNEVKVDRVEDLNGPQSKELLSLQESASATYQSIEEQMDALYEGILEKFAPSVQANVVSRESIEAQLIEALLDLEYIESIEVTPEQQINLRAFSELLDSTAEERRQFVQDIMEAENEAKRKEVRENLLAEQKRAREVAPQEVIEDERISIIEDESLPEVIPNVEFDFERTKNLTEFDSKIQSAADVYVGSKDSRKVTDKRTVLVNYIVTAPTKEQAIERAMFVLSLTNQANEQTQKLITELFNNPVNFFGELSFISALKSLGKIGEALAKKEAQIKTFQTAEIIEETPIVIEETPVEPVEQPETEIQTTTPVIPITNGSYGISYSNIHLLDPSSIDHKYAVRAKKILSTISRNLYDYQIRIVDLFTYLRETYGEQLITGKENSLQSFYEEAQAIEQIADDKERQQAQRQLKAKVDSFFGNYLQGVLSPSALNYHVSEIFLGSENGLKYPKTTQKSGYEDTNIIFGVAVRNGEIAKFNEEGELSETGAVMALTIARDETRPDMIESAIPGNVLRQSVVDNKSININVPILGIHDHTQSPDLSVGMSLDLMKASEFVSEGQKTLATERQIEAIDEELSELETEKGNLEIEKSQLEQDLNDSIQLLEEVKEEIQDEITKEEYEKAAADLQDAVDDLNKKIEDVIDSEIEQKELEEAAKEQNKTQEETKKEIVDKVKEELSTGKNTAKGAKTKAIVAKVAKVLRKIFYTFILSSFLFSTLAFADYTQSGNVNNTIETSLSILPDSYKESALRAATKAGLYDPSVNEVVVGEDMNETVRITSVAEVADTSTKAAYVRENTYTEVIGKVQDKHHKARKGMSDSLLMYRNQFFNENGFNYLTAPIRSQTKDHEKRYGTLGVAHFLILDDQAVDLTPASSDAKLKVESDKFKKTRIGNDIKAEDYVPVFTRKGDIVNLKYKKAKDVTSEDLVITKLLQYNFADINFNSKKSAQHIGFAKGVYHLTTHSGKDVVSLLFTDAGKKAYSRFSGGSVVFIFKDTLGNVIVRDFSGSTEMIGIEGKRIAKEFNISSNEITVGFFDAGSYSAKPAAKGGVLEMDQYKGYNILHPNSGGGLLLPTNSNIPIESAGLSIFGLFGLLAQKRKNNQKVSIEDIEDVQAKIKERLKEIDSRLKKIDSKIKELSNKKEALKKASIKKPSVKEAKAPVVEPKTYQEAVDEYKATELGSSETAKAKKQKVVDEAATPEGKRFVENQVAQMEKNEDGTITVYRSGTMQEGHNPATTSKKIAEIIANERKKQGLSSDIIEVRVNPSDISAVIPGMEREVFINVNSGNKQRIESNTKKEQKTKSQLERERKNVSDELEKTEEILKKAKEDKLNGTFKFSDSVYRDVLKKQENKIKNLKWQLTKIDKELAALENQTEPSVEPSNIETKKANIEKRRQEELISGKLPNVPDYIKEEIERNVIQEKEYLSDVLRLAYDNKTKSEIAKELNIDKEVVNSLRSYLGIPSMDSKTEFKEWKSKIDKINAKYDAELSALENEKQPTVEPSAEPIPQAPSVGVGGDVEAKRIETEAKIKRKDLFSDGGVFANELGGSGVNSVPTNHSERNGIEFVQFSNPNTGIVDVIMTGKSDNDFVGYYRIYENGKATNKWSSKFENQSRNKEDFKTMIGGVQEMLPQGHEYTEKTSISTDGLRVWNQQLSRGYELQYDSKGNLITNRVAINGDAINNELGIAVNKGNFENVSVTNNTDMKKVKEALLPYLQKFGLNESNIHFENGTVEIDLPVLKNNKAVEQSLKETPQAAPFNPSEPAKKIIAATNQEFSIAAVENVIRDTTAVPTPEGYLVNGKLYVSQSNYNKTSDGVTPQEDVDKAAFAVGDFVDLLGKDILFGIENVSKAEYEQRVIEKQNLTGNFTVSDALFYGLKSSFRAWKNAIESNGGKIFAQDMVLHSEFKSPNTSIKEGTTYYGVAGRPDIVIVDKTGKVHIVDMKNIKFGNAKGTPQYETSRRDIMDPISSNTQKRKDYWQTQQNTYAMMASGLFPEISSINILGIQSAYTTKDTGIEVTNLDIINFEDIANNSTIPLVGKLSLTAIQNRQKIASEFVARNPLTFVENTSNVPQSERPLCS